MDMSTTAPTSIQFFYTFFVYQFPISYSAIISGGWKLPISVWKHETMKEFNDIIFW